MEISNARTDISNFKCVRSNYTSNRCYALKCNWNFQWWRNPNPNRCLRPSCRQGNCSSSATVYIRGCVSSLPNTYVYHYVTANITYDARISKRVSHILHICHHGEISHLPTRVIACTSWPKSWFIINTTHWSILSAKVLLASDIHTVIYRTIMHPAQQLLWQPSIRLFNHERHPIPRPYERAMGVFLQRKWPRCIESALCL